MEQPLRVLIVDDAVTYRKVLSDILAEEPGVVVVGTAANGRIAVQKIEQLRPDVLTLDLEMPEMNGLELLRHLQANRADVGAIVLSASSSAGASQTLAALEAGAFDFVLKPNGASVAENTDRLARELRLKLTAYARRQGVRRILAGDRAGPPVAPGPAALPERPTKPPPVRTGSPQAVVIGISTGGPKALAQMLPQLPANLRVPVLVVQHMPPVFTASLAQDLNTRCALAVAEAQDGDPVVPGRIWIAPGGRQMGLARQDSGVTIRITDDPPENSCRPAVDYLFRAAADAYGGNVLAVVMTGMGYDGTSGCALLKARGAEVFVQDAASCVVFGMPRGPIEKGLADAVVPLDRMAAEIVRHVQGGAGGCR